MLGVTSRRRAVDFVVKMSAVYRPAVDARRRQRWRNMLQMCPCLIYLLLLPTPGVVVASPHDSSAISEACVEGTCASPVAKEDASLVQRTSQMRVEDLSAAQIRSQEVGARGQSDVFALQGFPDLAEALRKATDYVKDMPGFDVVKSMASGFVGDTAAQALVALGKAINNTLEGAVAKAKSFDTLVHTSKDFAQGVASKLVHKLNVSGISLPEATDVNVDVALAAAIVVWDAVDLSAKAVSHAITRGLEVVGLKDAAHGFDSVLRRALKSGSDIHVALRRLRNLITGETDSNASLLDEVNSTVLEARRKCEIFSKAFSEAFDTLLKQVLDACDGWISGGSLAKVGAAFSGAQGQAEALSATLRGASWKLIDSIRDGVEEAAAAVHSTASPGGLPAAAGGE